MAHARGERPRATTLAASEAGNTGSNPVGRKNALQDAENDAITRRSVKGPTLVASPPLST